MSFWNKIKSTLAGWMSDRHGPDELGLCLIIVGLAFDILSIATGFSLLSMLGLAAYIYAIFRMMSRNHPARAEENAKFLGLKSKAQTSARQFINRRKHSKEFKYFRCPGCHSLMRLKRGSGDRDMTCPKCGRQFHQKA